VTGRLVGNEPVLVGVQIDGVGDLCDPSMRTAENDVSLAHFSRLRSCRQQVHREATKLSPILVGGPRIADHQRQVVVVSSAVIEARKATACRSRSSQRSWSSRCARSRGWKQGANSRGARRVRYSPIASTNPQAVLAVASR